MTNNELIILIVLFFLTSVLGVVTGSNSLITVPVMFQFGINEKTAVATNMFGLTFMAIGGTIPFLRQGKVDARKLSPLIVLTIAGSALGALLVGFITNQSIKLIVSIAMIVVVIFTLIRPKTKSSPPHEGGVAEGRGGSLDDAQSTRSDVNERTTPGGLTADGPLLRKEGSFWGLAVVFLLAIYGGLYSGGYVTVLTAAFVVFLGMSYAESVASTKLVNVFSSSVATLVFMWQGLVDYKLGAILAVTMFVGAFVGAHYAAKMNEVWLKRIFLSTVLFLAIKTFYDFL